MPVYSKVYAYLRFSSDVQADGNSFERQRSITRDFLKSAGISEELVEWVEDPGMSAFTGDHIKSGALGKLMRRIRDKSISDGLIIFESVDRASREGGMKFLVMLSEILEGGFSVHILDSGEKEPFTITNPPKFLFTILSLKADLANLESQRKSELSGDNWERKRQLARTEGTPLTAECPRWLKLENGKYVEKTNIIDSIIRVFRLASEGWGISRILRHANMQKWPAPATSGTWHTSLLNRLFCNRALIGELQLYEGSKSRRRPSGEPVKDYYPCVIDPMLFYDVRGKRDIVASFPHRRDTNNYNYLMGLGKCECGGTWRRLNKNSGKQLGYSQYSCSNRQRGVTNCVNLSGRMFDYNFIGIACEKIPALLSVVDDKRAALKSALQSQITDINRRLQKLLDLYEMSDVDDMAEVRSRIKNLKAELKGAKARLVELEVNAPPQGPFDFGAAVEAYLPSFLNVFTEAAPEQVLAAFNARALFRVRVLEAVVSVEISLSRTLMRITLKNGVVFDEDIRSIEFSQESDYESVEIESMDKRHSNAVGILMGSNH